MLTQTKLQELLRYNPDNGVFTWNISKPGCAFGKKVGCVLSDGRIQIMLNYKKYLAHKLAFLYMEGSCPDEVDHKDTNPTNNAWENLRAATHSQNMMNRKVMSHSETGVKNVRFRKDRNTYVVSLVVDGKRRIMGSRKNLQDANLLAIDSRNKHHGEYARHV